MCLARFCHIQSMTTAMCKSVDEFGKFDDVNSTTGIVEHVDDLVRILAINNVPERGNWTVFLYSISGTMLVWFSS